jgi:putative FmdB family regulatory protein
MPTYSYRCSACNHTFDKVQRITEDAIKVCEACGAETASRLITSGNFVLKGSGWYGDLYSGSSNKKNAAPADSSSSTTSSTKAAGCDGAGACAAPAAATPTTTTTPSTSSN